MNFEFERYADQKRLDFITGVLHESLPEKATILDVGCGNGIISRNLGRKGFNVLGVDVSPKTIEKAKSLNDLPNVTFKVLSAEELSVSETKYHAIICSEVIEHLSKPSLLLNALHQSLQPNGVLIVTVPNGKGPRELFVTRPIQNMQKKNGFMWKFVQKVKKMLGYSGTTVQSSADDLSHIQFFTQKSLQQLAAETQFEIVKFGKTNFIEDVFPFSLLTKRLKFLQRLDCALAERLPYSWNGGFVSVWKRK